MPIYSHNPYHPKRVFESCEAHDCDAHLPLHSTLGRGPRGHSISVDVVDGDPYGFFRLQFKDSVTGDVLMTTPNLDPGSRVYICDKDLIAQYDNKYDALISEFTTEQLGSIRDIRVGDIVMFKAHESDIYMLGVGVVNSINGDTVNFTSHINLSAGNIKESLDEYIDRYINRQVAILTNKIDTYLDNSIAQGLADLEDLKQQMLGFTKAVFFGLTTDGHFVAYIPENWSEIVFDTGSDYSLDTYGRLILRMIVDDSSLEVDQTPEVVRPYTDADLERKVYNIIQTLYSAQEG